MICPNCGNELEDGVRFCGECGADVGENLLQTPPPSPAEPPESDIQTPAEPPESDIQTPAGPPESDIQTPAVPPVAVPAPPAPQPEKKKSKGAVTALIAVLAVLVVCLAGLIVHRAVTGAWLWESFSQGGKGSEDDGDGSKSSSKKRNQKEDGTAPSAADTSEPEATVQEPTDAEQTSEPEEQTTVDTPEDTSATTEPSSVQPSQPSDETTAPPVSDPTAPPVSEAPKTSVEDYVRSLGKTQYDILRSGQYAIVGTTSDETGALSLKMARAPGKLYVVSEADGLSMGIYITGDKTYLYYPKAKKYTELTDAISSMIGMDPKEFSSMAEDMGFGEMPPLSEAERMEDVTVNGVACKAFRFAVKDGEGFSVYLSGTKLIRIERRDVSGRTTFAMDFTSVSADFPQMPPNGYTQVNVIDFMTTIMQDMG